MADQLALALDLPPLAPPDPTIADRWMAFSRANPHIGRELLRRARELRDIGLRRIGVKYLWESLRVDRVRVSGVDDYRLDNRLTSRYARFLIENDPSLAPLIETRALRSA